MDSWQINCDLQVMAVARQFPFILGNMLTNEYLRARVDVDQYVLKASQGKEIALRDLHGLVTGAEAVTLINNLWRRYQTLSLKQVRMIAVGLFTTLAHLKHLAEKASIEPETVAKDDFVIEMCKSFCAALQKTFPQEVIDADAAISYTVELLEDDTQFGAKLNSSAMARIYSDMFIVSRGNSMETQNPCEMMEILFRGFMQVLRQKGLSEDAFKVISLNPNMCYPQMLCNIPFGPQDIRVVPVGADFKMTKGFELISPDKAMEETSVYQSDVGPWMKHLRKDFFRVLLCSAVYKLEVPIKEACQHAFFLPTSDNIYQIPEGNYELLKGICEVAATISESGPDALPDRVVSSGRYFLIKPAAKRRMDIGPPGRVSMRATPRTPEPVDPEGVVAPIKTDRGLYLIVAAVALLALYVR